MHVAQLLSYLRLSGISFEFLFNFNVRSFKDGIRRIVLNDKKTFSTSSTSSTSWLNNSVGQVWA
ncbi:MAG: GxxExxY protein [Spirochaetaceae bacterium]|nr:GxxExxY protein [Spirochaetaceae bacterium]